MTDQRDLNVEAFVAAAGLGGQAAASSRWAWLADRAVQLKVGAGLVATTLFVLTAGALKGDGVDDIHIDPASEQYAGEDWDDREPSQTYRSRSSSSDDLTPQQQAALMQMFGAMSAAAQAEQRNRQMGQEDARMEAMQRLGFDSGQRVRNRWGGWTVYNASGGQIQYATDSNGNYVIPPTGSGR